MFYRISPIKKSWTNALSQKPQLYTLSQRALKREQWLWRYQMPVNATGTTIVKEGFARFDLDPSFLCVVLFLDSKYTLVLREEQGEQCSRIAPSLVLANPLTNVIQQVLSMRQ